LEVKLVFASGPRSSESAGEPSGDLGELLDRIDEDTLDSKAREFVIQTKERYVQYKNRTRMSEKQMNWLREIATGANRKDEW
jgi:hypothetical protein